MSTGILSFIELMHISYHNKIDHDIHGHVREFCRNNPDVCQFKDWSVDKCKEIIYNVTILHRSFIVTVSSNDQGQQNMWAKEPRMYIDQTAAERYGYETYAEKAEKLNGRTAMIGFVAAVLSYATSGSLFFFGVFGIWHILDIGQYLLYNIVV